jgi:hypothetical protein
MPWSAQYVPVLSILPIQLTSFIGRDCALVQVTRGNTTEASTLPARHVSPAVAWFLACVALATAACGASGHTSGATSLPSPDRLVALVHSYHDEYVAARGNGYGYCVVELDAQNCHDRGVAMIAVWERFLKDLDATPIAPKFTADVATIRSQLPKGIDDLRTMVAAAAAGDKTAMHNAAEKYAGDMVPTVTDALGDIYAPWRRE